MLQGVSVVWLPVDDMDRAVGFYEGTLGLTVRDRQEQWAEIDAGEVTIGLNARDSESPGGEGGAVVAIPPDGEIHDTLSELEGKGVELAAGGITDHPWGRVATFKDPDGNDLQLYAPPK